MNPWVDRTRKGRVHREAEARARSACARATSASASEADRQCRLPRIVLLARYLQQRCLLIGSTPYDCPILALFHGPVDITEDGCGDVGVPESVDVGLGNVDEYVLGGIGVGPFEEGASTGMPKAVADMSGCRYEPDQQGVPATMS